MHATPDRDTARDRGAGAAGGKWICCLCASSRSWAFSLAAVAAAFAAFDAVLDWSGAPATQPLEVDGLLTSGCSRVAAAGVGARQRNGDGNLTRMARI